MHPQDISFENIMQELVGQQTRSAQPTGVNPHAQVVNQQIGVVGLQSSFLPGLHISQVQWEVGKYDLRFEDKTHSDDININLQLKGHLFTQFNCLSNPLDMQPGRHNLILTSEPGGHHVVKAGDRLEMFHLSLKPEHLCRFLDESTPMGNKLLSKLEKKEAFAASPQPLSITPDMQAVIADMKHCSLQGNTRRLYQEAKITELLCLLLDGYANYYMPLSKLPGRNDVEKLYALREYLHRHYLQQELSLASLGREFGLNEFTLKKGFKQLFNTTVFGYIQKLRMEHARLLMLEGGLSVSEAADALGYANPQHFSTAYKKQYGISPRKFALANK
ncbi:AraC family transcriptional regulator [Flammeovirgaceae bacterium 311]|nr:AraC family transcriptional regulator [Flammeovirgaceae bacterium 311]